MSDTGTTVAVLSVYRGCTQSLLSDTLTFYGEKRREEGFVRRVCKRYVAITYPGWTLIDIAIEEAWSPVDDQSPH